MKIIRQKHGITRRDYENLWGCVYVVFIFFILPGIAGGMEEGTISDIAAYLSLFSLLILSCHGIKGGAK